jgi:hypothetical protein
MALLLVMADVANKGGAWQVWLPREELARRSRVSVSSVGRHLAALETSGAIRKRTGEERVGRARGNRVVVWQLAVEPFDGAIPKRSDCAPRESSKGSDCASRETGIPLSSTTQEIDPTNLSPSERKALAREIVNAWWDWHRERGIPRPMGVYHAHVAIVANALDAGWTARQIKRALVAVDGSLAQWRLENALKGLRAGSRPVDVEWDRNEPGGRIDPSEAIGGRR